MMPDASEEFVRLYTASQTEIHRYILAMVPDRENAQEILQETVLDLWKKLDQYDRSQPFVNWGCRFALNRVLKYRREQGKASKLLSPAMLEQLAVEQESEPSAWKRRREHALTLCLEELPKKDHALLMNRYGKAQSIKQAAAEAGKTADSLYSRLKRLRAALYDCVQRRLAEEGAGE